MSDLRKPVGLTEEDEKDIRLLIQHLADVLSGKSDICLHCQQQFTELMQVGHCVYASPCGCRQYQGTVPKRWGKHD